MRPIGFSTGALAYADFRRGLAIIRNKGLHSIELSALRQNELVPLLEAIPRLELSGFKYISIHAPSQYEPAWEEELCERLHAEKWRGWPIIVHPDAIHDFSLWRRLGAAVCIENMDRRKSIGRTASELAGIFEKVPEATLCFDIGHARQVDLTMTEAYLILREFGSNLTQVHVSEVNARSKHDPLSYSSMLGFRDVARLIPAEVPLILETPVAEGEIEAEIEKVRQSLPLDLQTMVA
ncbi:MAG: hypothetical protein JO307_25175 [Bryobacterales bacterium]|nr:hypothetical protein [Bryobacterales bacterium]MBV9401750.1 hypothetical protein [Bryobacterales bacterium]